jgi:hypothetical protein
MKQNTGRGTLPFSRQPEWTLSPHESQPRTDHGRKYARWSRRSGWSELLIIAWLGALVIAVISSVAAKNWWLSQASTVQSRDHRQQSETTQASPATAPVSSHTGPITEQQSAPSTAKCYGHSPDGALKVYAPVEGRCREGG